MQLPERPIGFAEETAASGDSPRAGGFVESKEYCVYNQTRECFLGLDVTVSDLTPEDLQAEIEHLAMKPGEGLWIRTFHGMPATGSLPALDWIYLDEDCRVIETAESFPASGASLTGPEASSALALPPHSIYLSQTQRGDRLVVCAAKEMQSKLEKLSGPGSSTSSVESAVLLREQPLWSGGPGLLELKGPPGQDRGMEQKAHEMPLAAPGNGTFEPPTNWLKRWWSPDPRSAPRITEPRVAAYFWTGDSPKAHAVRDISAPGLYVVTEERWYPGTLVLMTLQRTDAGEETTERSIAVQTRAVRWGKDGVGLQFVMQNPRDTLRGQNVFEEVATKKQFDQFLELLRKAK